MSFIPKTTLRYLKETLENCRDYTLISGITAFLCGDECDKFFTAFKGCVAYSTRKFEAALDNPRRYRVNNGQLLVEKHPLETHIVHCASSVAARQEDIDLYHAIFRRFDETLSRNGLSPETTIWDKNTESYKVTPYSFARRRLSRTLPKDVSNAYEKALEELIKMLLSSMICNEQAMDLALAYSHCCREVKRELHSEKKAGFHNSGSSGVLAMGEDGELRVFNAHEINAIWERQKWQEIPCIRIKNDISDLKERCQLEPDFGYWNIYLRHVEENGDDAFGSWLLRCAKRGGHCDASDSDNTFGRTRTGENDIQQAIAMCKELLNSDFEKEQTLIYINNRNTKGTRGATVQGVKRATTADNFNRRVIKCAQERIARIQDLKRGSVGALEQFGPQLSDGVEGGNIIKKWNDKAKVAFNDFPDGSSFATREINEMQRREYIFSKVVTVIWASTAETDMYNNLLMKPVVDSSGGVSVIHTVARHDRDLGTFLKLDKGIGISEIPEYNSQSGEKRGQTTWVALYAFLLQKAAETSLHHHICRANAHEGDDCSFSWRVRDVYVSYMAELEGDMKSNKGWFMTVEDVAYIVRSVADAFSSGLGAKKSPILDLPPSHSAAKFNMLMEHTWIVLTDLSLLLMQEGSDDVLMNRLMQGTILGKFAYGKIPLKRVFLERINPRTAEIYRDICNEVKDFDVPVSDQYDHKAVALSMAQIRENTGKKNPYSLSNEELHVFLFMETDVPESPFAAMKYSIIFFDGFSEAADQNAVFNIILNHFFYRINELTLEEDDDYLRFYSAYVVKQMYSRGWNDFHMILYKLSGLNIFRLEGSTKEKEILKLLVSTLFVAMLKVFGISTTERAFSVPLFGGLVMRPMGAVQFQEYFMNFWTSTPVFSPELENIAAYKVLVNRMNALSRTSLFDASANALHATFDIFQESVKLAAHLGNEHRFRNIPHRLNTMVQKNFEVIRVSSSEPM